MYIVHTCTCHVHEIFIHAQTTADVHCTCTYKCNTACSIVQIHVRMLRKCNVQYTYSCFDIHIACHVQYIHIAMQFEFAGPIAL